MTPSARAALLLSHVRDLGWTIEFFSTSDKSMVHVIAPDACQPGSPDPVYGLLFRRFRTICGRVFHTSPLEGTLNDTFQDQRLCALCHKAFATPRDQAVIFEHNTPFYQDSAASSNASLRIHALPDPTP